MDTAAMTVTLLNHHWSPLLTSSFFSIKGYINVNAIHATNNPTDIIYGAIAWPLLSTCEYSTSLAFTGAANILFVFLVALMLLTWSAPFCNESFNVLLPLWSVPIPFPRVVDPAANWLDPLAICPAPDANCPAPLFNVLLLATKAAVPDFSVFVPL